MIVAREQATAFQITTEAEFSCGALGGSLHRGGASGGHRGHGGASGHHGYAQTNCRLPSHDGGRILARLGPCHHQYFETFLIIEIPSN